MATDFAPQKSGDSVTDSYTEPMFDSEIHAGALMPYLSRLERELWKRGLPDRRILDEVREHLIEAFIDDVKEHIGGGGAVREIADFFELCGASA